MPHNSTPDNDGNHWMSSNGLNSELPSTEPTQSETNTDQSDRAGDYLVAGTVITTLSVKMLATSPSLSVEQLASGSGLIIGASLIARSIHRYLSGSTTDQ